MGISKPASQSEVEVELRRMTGVQLQRNEDRQAFLRRLKLGVDALDEGDYFKLSTGAQKWANEAADSVDYGTELPEFEAVETTTADEAVDQGEEVQEPDDATTEDQVAAATATATATQPNKVNGAGTVPRRAAPKAPAAKKAAAPKASVAKVPAPKAAGGTKRPGGSKPGEVRGKIQTAIKEMVLDDPKITAEGILNVLSKKGVTSSQFTVAAIRADFRDTIRLLENKGLLKRAIEL